MIAEDWNAPKWASGAKEDKEREQKSLGMKGVTLGGWRRADRVRVAWQQDGQI